MRGTDQSNAPSMTPTMKEHPLCLVQTGSGYPDAARHLKSRSLQKASLSEDTLESRHAWTPWWKRLKWGCRNNRSHQGSTRGGWVSRSRRSVDHSFSGQRGSNRVMEILGVSLTMATTRPTRGKGENTYTSRLGNASSKTAWGSGTRKQYRGSFALRHVANRSSDGEPQTQYRVTSEGRRKGWTAPRPRPQ